MKLGKRQTKVLEILKGNQLTIPEIVSLSGLQEHIVKNILMELYDAEIIRKTEAGIVSLRDKVSAAKTTDEINHWRPIQKEFIYEPELKNLSRKV